MNMHSMAREDFIPALLPSLSGSMSPNSIAVKSMDYQRPRSRDSAIRKFAMLSGARSNSIELQDGDFKLQIPPPVFRGSKAQCSPKPISITIPPYEEEQRRFYQEGGFFLQVEKNEAGSEDAFYWPPVSPTDLDMKSPNQILKENIRKRFFQESGFDDAEDFGSQEYGQDK